MKNLWIVANWKSNKDIREALEWVDMVGPKLERRENLQVAVCPTFVAIEEVKKAVLVGNYPMMVGAQDLSPFEDGPYTGEESARILSELVDLVILGHSERRNNFGETDEVIAEKVEQAKTHNILPLVCVQDENTPVPEGVKLVAYEPVFAIGTGHPESAENAGRVAQKLTIKNDRRLEILYGGSVTAENAKPFLQSTDLSGLLIGGASLDPEEFLKIIDIAKYC
ncbi:MAG: triosephosphate isomerase [Armatimonadetes bacterium]|nr:MAG: triosephosphate isomerase [Armatimonadota bacterium]